MPELPEVETIRTQLADKLIDRKIAGVDVRLPKMFQGDKSKVIGAKITNVRRRAKMLIIKLDNSYNLAIHLKMTGQLIYGESNGEILTFPNPIPFAGIALPAKNTHVILNLDKGRLFFNDNRQFGWIKVLNDEQLIMNHERLGPEPFSKEFTPEYLEKICSNWGRPIKLLLMEQAKIAGIGNIYANEALWCSGISPMKRGRELAKESEKIKKLHSCILETLEKGLKYGGSSAEDEAFVNVSGEKGHMQEHFVVYQQNGKKCPRCGGTITVGRLGGRGTFFCPKCQR